MNEVEKADQSIELSSKSAIDIIETWGDWFRRACLAFLPHWSDVVTNNLDENSAVLEDAKKLSIAGLLITVSLA